MSKIIKIVNTFFLLLLFQIITNRSARWSFRPFKDLFFSVFFLPLFYRLPPKYLIDLGRHYDSLRIRVRARVRARVRFRAI